MKKAVDFDKLRYNLIRYAWRNFDLKEYFGGREKITIGKRTFYLDTTVIGQVLDVFENLGFCTKEDKMRPQIINKRKTEYGWHLVINLPPGLCFRQVADKKEFFQCATNSYVEMQWLNGNVHMDIQQSQLPTLINYEWDPTPYLKKMYVPTPIGYSHKELVVWDLASDSAPHYLLGGATGGGKSNAILGLIHSLLPLQDMGRVKVCIIDRKGVDFENYKKHILVVESEEESLGLLKYLWKEHENRIKQLKKEGVKKLLHLKNPPPFIVCIIDEFAELQTEESHGIIDQIARLSRAPGIRLVAATQKPSSKKMNTDTRSQFDLRMCFPMASEIDSRMILGETNSEAAWLQRIPGRALFKSGLDLTEVQTMYLSDEKAKELLKTAEPRRWDVEQQTKRLAPR